MSEQSTQGRPGRETSHGSGEKTPVHGCFPEGTPAGLMFDLKLGCTPLKPWDVRSSKGAWDGRGCYLHFPMNASICINLVSLCMRTLPCACICLKSNMLSLWCSPLRARTGLSEIQTLPGGAVTPLLASNLAMAMDVGVPRCFTVR